MDDSVSGTLKKEKSAAEIRKSNKPLMEKRRRERINNCLDQLKSILMEVTKKESSYYSKLEKADILEMTVKYLKNMKRQQLAVAMANDPSVVSKYIAGFNECTTEVTKYLGGMDGLTTEMRSRLMGHLADCLQRQFTLNQPSNCNQNLASGPQSLGVQLPTATQLNSLPGSGGVCLLSPGNGNPQIQTIPASPMQLVPAKLPNGDLVFLLTNPSQVLANSTANGVSVVSALQTTNSCAQPIINLSSAQQSNVINTSGMTTVSTLGLSALSPSPAIAVAPNRQQEQNNNVLPAVLIQATETSTPTTPIKEEQTESASSSPVSSASSERVTPQSSYSHVSAPRPREMEEEEQDRLNNNNNILHNEVAPDEGPMWRPW